MTIMLMQHIMSSAWPSTVEISIVQLVLLCDLLGFLKFWDLVIDVPFVSEMWSIIDLERTPTSRRRAFACLLCFYQRVNAREIDIRTTG